MTWITELGVCWGRGNTLLIIYHIKKSRGRQFRARTVAPWYHQLPSLCLISSYVITHSLRLFSLWLLHGYKIAAPLQAIHLHSRLEIREEATRKKAWCIYQESKTYSSITYTSAYISLAKTLTNGPKYNSRKKKSSFVLFYLYYFNLDVLLLWTSQRSVHKKEVGIKFT